MKNVMKIGAVLVAAAMLFTGCGDPMMPLTEDEESVVVYYSAGILAKHNSFQQEGMTAVYPDEEEAEEQEEPEETKESEETEEDKEDKEEKKEKKSETEEQQTEEGSEEGPKQLTLTEALSISKVEFSYHDYSTTASYRQGDYFSLDASEGNTFLILNVNMTNTGNKAVECDIMKKQLSFILNLNEEAGVQNQVTILTNDLSTYKGTLEPGQTEAVILIFEVPEKTAENISTMKLSLESNGEVNEIILK